MLDMKALAEAMAAIVKSHLEATIAPLQREIEALKARQPERGEKGDAGGVGEKGDPGEPGKSITVDDVAPSIEAAVAKAVAAIKVPKGDRGEKGDTGEPGKSVTIDDVASLIESAIAKAVAAIPAPKDGVGLAGAIIDRRGALVLTLSDGRACDLGPVVGKDGDPGLGFDDLDVVYDGARCITLRLLKGERIKEFSFQMPIVIDRGVWIPRDEGYAKGDGCSWGGSFWIAQRDTAAKPDTADSGWRLAVKRGQNGKDAGK